MGQKHPDFTLEDHQFHERFEKDYKYERDEVHPLYGKIKIYSSKSVNSPKIMVISHPLRNELEQEDFKKEIIARSQFQHPNLLKVLGWNVHISDHLCGNSGHYEIFLPYMKKNLASELLRRMEKQEFFYENELWYIAQSLINVASYLQQHGVFHGDYRPETILINENEDESGSICVADNGLIGLYKTGYERSLCEDGTKTYLNEFLLAELYRKEPKPVYNVYQNDIFSIGMVLLYCCTLKDPHEYYYHWWDNELEIKTIKFDLRELENRYSRKFLYLIEGFLNFEGKGIDFMDLSELNAFQYNRNNNISNNQVVATQTNQSASRYIEPVTKDIVVNEQVIQKTNNKEFYVNSSAVNTNYIQNPPPLPPKEQRITYTFSQPIQNIQPGMGANLIESQLIHQQHQENVKRSGNVVASSSQMLYPAQTQKIIVQQNVIQPTIYQQQQQYGSITSPVYTDYNYSSQQGLLNERNYENNNYSNNYYRSGNQNENLEEEAERMREKLMELERQVQRAINNTENTINQGNYQ